MKKPDITEGNWKVKKSPIHSNQINDFIVNESGQMFVAEIMLNDTDAATKGNAKLIAAAPELAEALLRAYSHIDIWSNEWQYELPASVKSLRDTMLIMKQALLKAGYSE